MVWAASTKSSPSCLTLVNAKLAYTTLVWDAKYMALQWLIIQSSTLRTKSRRIIRKPAFLLRRHLVSEQRVSPGLGRPGLNGQKAGQRGVSVLPIVTPKVLNI